MIYHANTGQNKSQSEYIVTKVEFRAKNNTSNEDGYKGGT